MAVAFGSVIAPLCHRRRGRSVTPRSTASGTGMQARSLLVPLLGLVVACGGRRTDRTDAEPSEADRVARAEVLEREGTLAEARAALPDDCHQDVCFAAKVRIGKALAASLEG